ncbi:MAG: fumarylacetoacetate hydrolase family protein [Bacteroidota bacterium]
MRFRKLQDHSNTTCIVAELDGQWHSLDHSLDLLHLLDKSKAEIAELVQTTAQASQLQDIIPFRPTAYRDFMLYEKHAIDAARGFVKKYMPHLFPLVSAWERMIGPPFPKLKPHKRFYQHPIYYLGNHLNVYSEGDRISIPSYTKELDYELELGAVITKPLKNASIEEVEDAIGGFVILNDFSARDVQLDEMRSGFGPMKTKNFGSAISAVITSKNALIDKLDQLSVEVIINGQSIVSTDTKGKRYSFQEAIAYASWEEQLHPGELFGSGTIPGCTGIENGIMLQAGDNIRLEVEGIGSLSNTIG